MIAGGLHLLVAQDDAIAKVTGSLRDTWKVAYIAPGHCTGEPTFVALREAFGNRYLYAGLGTVVVLGAQPQALTDQAVPFAMDQEDLRTYRALLARSDDILDTAAVPTMLGLAR
jgi:7,8-dihydropterin-6-yl-methyl-4-(beta-D-ribofuranosyl)aminobenzene 5'-phosphate synthase